MEEDERGGVNIETLPMVFVLDTLLPMKVLLSRCD